MGEAFVIILAPTICIIVCTLKWAFVKWIDTYVEQTTKKGK